MRVIPVMDIQGNIVVHGRRGERDRYQPIKSVLTPSTQPIDVARAMWKAFNFKELYIADLDAIQMKGGAYEPIREISKATAMKLIVDSGAANVQKARAVEGAGASKIVVATETLGNVNALSRIVEELGAEKIVASLDMRNGKVLSKSAKLRKMTPPTVARILEEAGASQLIVLDLARVGSESGVDMTPVESVLRITSIPVITGGGVRDIDDMIRLEEMGVDGVLIATSLHAGVITPSILHDFRERDRLAHQNDEN